MLIPAFFVSFRSAANLSGTPSTPVLVVLVRFSSEDINGVIRLNPPFLVEMCLLSSLRYLMYAVP